MKPANLNQELFVVLVPKDNLLNTAEKVQQVLADYYNLYPDQLYPELHITIDRINKDRVFEAKEILCETLEKFDKILLEINKYSCLRFSKEHHLILEVIETPSLISFATLLHERLFKAGISTIKNYQEWIFHITVINNLFTKNPIPEKDFEKICVLMDSIAQPIISSAKSVEIWRPTLESAKKKVCSYDIS